ncbi:MAG: alginate lyase family protein, partial [Onishia taeanensis]|uniref:alginate lyase family protein n=1 Tax=Onishia taeanensis TaxID=284577 RepID=UPI003C7BFF91
MILPFKHCRLSRQLLAGLCTVLAGLAMSLPATAMTLEQRAELDLSEYKVTAPKASYFDVDERMAMLGQTDNPILIQEIDQLATGQSCKQLMAIDPITTRLRIPGYYPSPDAWKLASEPLFAFSDSVSGLAGAYMATGDDYYAKCLMRFLDQWANDKALTNFFYDSKEPQAWFATESMIFAAAMAYSTVEPRLEGMDEEKERIETWLNGLA